MSVKPSAEYIVRKQDLYILVEDRDNGVAVAADIKAVVGSLRQIGMVNDKSLIVLRDPFGKFDRVKPDGSLSYLDAATAQEALAS
jgi:hypothetical protein